MSDTLTQPSPDDPPTAEPGDDGPMTPRTRLTTVVAVATAAAGLVHAAAVGTHSDDVTLAWLFALTAVAQVGTAAVAFGWRSSKALLPALTVDAAALGAWAVSRTTGIPLVASLAEPAGASGQDLAAAGLAGVALVAGLAAGLAARADRPARISVHQRLAPVAWLAVLVVALAGMVTPHDHDHGPHDQHLAVGERGASSHDHADHASASHGAGHGDHGADHHDPGDDVDATDPAADPVFVGADTSGLTDGQLEVAAELVTDTRAAVAARFTDEASVVAAGYRSIGDGRRVGGYEHFVHPDYTADGRELDPDAVESLVFEVTPDGKVLASAMYLLEPGATMDDVPDIAGDLTVWHDHQNLCFDDDDRIAGVLVNGSCSPGGTLRPTVPMLHVWLDDHGCGPFSGIEGHGGEGGCDHSH